MNIEQGSKSFAFASRFFLAPQRRDAAGLYGWCRYCDDQIDEAKNSADADIRLDEIRKLTQSSLRQKLTSQSLPVFSVLAEVVERNQIPPQFALELLDGMEMDVQQRQYRNLGELELYCYRVASTVGVMMTHIMTVKSPRAFPHAISLGKAMQLTNIARDVLDDFKLGRIYLPILGLVEAGLPIDANLLLSPRYRTALVPLVAELLDRAEILYQDGKRGLRYLPFRSAVAVAIAAVVYRAIGRKVRARGPAAWEQRVYVPLLQKMGLAGVGLLWAIQSRFERRSK